MRCPSWAHTEIPKHDARQLLAVCWEEASPHVARCVSGSAWGVGALLAMHSVLPTCLHAQGRPGAQLCPIGSAGWLRPARPPPSRPLQQASDSPWQGKALPCRVGPLLVATTPPLRRSQALQAMTPLFICAVAALVALLLWRWRRLAMARRRWVLIEALHCHCLYSQCVIASCCPCPLNFCGQLASPAEPLPFQRQVEQRIHGLLRKRGRGGSGTAARQGRPALAPSRLPARHPRQSWCCDRAIPKQPWGAPTMHGKRLAVDHAHWALPPQPQALHAAPDCCMGRPATLCFIAPSKDP